MRELSLQKVIYQILSKEFQKEILPEFWLVTITGVKVAKDFSYWDVFISNLPENKSVLDFLNSKIGHFQSLINKKMERKKVPKLRFHFDSSGDFAANLENL